MKALNQNFFKSFSEKIFNTLASDEEMSINLSAEDTLFTRFSRARVRQVTEVEQGYANINFIKGNKSIVVYLNYTGEVELDVKHAIDKLNRARTYLAVMNDDPFIVRPKNLGNSTQESVHYEISGEDISQKVSRIAGETDLAGLLTSGEIIRGSMNSKGQSHWFKTQNIVLDYSIYNSKQKAVKSLFASNIFDERELELNINSAKEKLVLMNREVRSLPKGEYRTYLAPGAVSELMGTLSWGGVSMAAHQRGQGSLKEFWKGTKKLSPKFSLCEDFNINMSPRFNEIGEASPVVLPLITNGEFTNFLTSTRSSNEFKVETNHASDWESMRSASIAPGELIEENIIKIIGNGLYISDLHYLNWSDRETSRITGMTRYACFLVENGELIAPIEDLRFDESYYHIFGTGLVDLTNKVHLIPSTGSYFEREVGGMQVPGIIVDNFKFTL